MIDDLPDLDAAGLLARASDAVQARRRAEIHDLEVLAQWAAVHSSDPTEGPEGAVARRLGNVVVQVGGDGTPGVQDFCLGEIALARGTGVMASRHALADVLDLQHRLPLTWAVCRRGECEVWVARRVAKLSRHLDADKVALVDSAMSRMIATESAGRVLEVAEAKVIEADPALHEEKCEAERRSRFARLGRTDEFGLRMLIARLDAGDAVAVEATVCRVAEIIAPRHPEATPDELRALAFAWLARPAELFTLLLEHTEPEAGADPELDLDVTEQESEPEPTSVSRALAFPAHLLDALRDIDLTPWAPGESCTSTFTKQPSTAPKASPASKASGRSPSPGSPSCSHESTSRSNPSRTSPTASATPPTNTPSHSATRSTSSPAATTGPTPPPPAARSTSTTPLPSTTAPARAPVENPRRTRPAPTTPAPSADDTIAGRPTRATSHASAAKDATSGSPPMGSPSSSTTQAPAASTPRRRG